MTGRTPLALLVASLLLPAAAAIPAWGPHEPDHAVSCAAPCVAVHEASPTPLKCEFFVGGPGAYSCALADSASPPNSRTVTCVLTGVASTCHTSGTAPSVAPFSAACAATLGGCVVRHA